MDTICSSHFRIILRNIHFLNEFAASIIIKKKISKLLWSVGDCKIPFTTFSNTIEKHIFCLYYTIEIKFLNQFYIVLIYI